MKEDRKEVRVGWDLEGGEEERAWRDLEGREEGEVGLITLCRLFFGLFLAFDEGRCSWMKFFKPLWAFDGGLTGGDRGDSENGSGYIEELDVNDAVNRIKG